MRESDAKERADLKRENKALKQQVAKLRKQLQKSLDTYQVVVDDALEQQESVAEQQGASPGGGCDKCGSHNLARLDMPSGGTLVACKDCKFRKKI